jgi:hypothetical protein
MTQDFTVLNTAMRNFAAVYGKTWKRPDGGANVETLDKIAQVLGVSIADLMEHVPDERK